MRSNMRFLNLLLNVGVIVIINVLPWPTVAQNSNTEDDSFPSYNSSLENFLEPLLYNIELTLNNDRDVPTFSGRSEIRIKINRATEYIDINVHELDIKRNVILIQEKVHSYEENYTSAEYPVHSYIEHQFQNILIFYFTEVVQPGNYILHMEYDIPTDKTKGLVRTKYINSNGNTTWLFTTNLEPYMARRVFPCWDEQPELKSIFNISIKHPTHYTALSNMPILRQINGESGIKLTLFDFTPKITPTQVSIALFEQFFTLHSTDTINVMCRPRVVFKLIHAHNIGTKISLYMSSHYADILRSQPKIDYVAIPSLSHKATSGWGLTVFREPYLEYHETLHLADHKLDVSTIITSQIAQQNFEYLINPSSWTHLWLNNGLTNILGLNILSKVYDNPQMIPLMFYRIQQQARQHKYLFYTVNIPKRLKSENDIYNIDSPYCCVKESVLMRMLENIVGEDIFKKGIIKYFQKYSYKSATIDDLWAVFQEALDDSTSPHCDFYVKEIMDTWITQDYYPIVTVTRNYDTDVAIITQKSAYERKNTNSIYYNHKHYNNNNNNNNKWWVPLNFITQNDSSIRSSWLRPTHPNVTLGAIDRSGWIIVNVQHIGYYRVNYDRENWLKIAHYLNTENFEIIPELSRAHMIDDAYHFLKRGNIDSVIFFKLTEYLKNETTSYVPWFALKHILSELWPIFKLPEAKYLQSHLVNISDGILKKIGYEDQFAEDDNRKLIRLFATDLACRLNNTDCRKSAKTKLEAFINYTIPFSPWWEKWLYCNGMRDANMITWSTLLRKYLSTNDPEILECLTYSEDMDIIIYYLNLISSKDAQKELYNMQLSNKIQYNIFKSIITKHATNPLLLNHILTTLNDQISPHFMTSVLSDVIENLYSTEQLLKIIQFTYNVYLGKLDSEIIQHKIDRRMAQIKKLKWLANLFQENRQNSTKSLYEMLQHE